MTDYGPTTEQFVRRHDVLGLRIEMVDTTSGERRVRTDSSWTWAFPSEFGGASMFEWSEGNWACDCNRFGLWEDGEYYGKCGEGRFRVRITTLDGQEELYRDEGFPDGA